MVRLVIDRADLFLWEATMDATYENLLLYAAHTARVWNQPVIDAGDLSEEELQYEISKRRQVLRRVGIKAAAKKLLTDLPDELFHRV
jgi:hypothetical protein